jgi:hypothetical protein
MVGPDYPRISPPIVNSIVYVTYKELFLGAEVYLLKL